MPKKNRSVRLVIQVYKDCYASDFRSTTIWSIFSQNLESKLEQELVQTDQKLVLEMDRVVADQQTTMQVHFLASVYELWKRKTFWYQISMLSFI